MNTTSKTLLSAALAIGLTATAQISQALPTIGMAKGERKVMTTLKTTAAACNPATATIDLDINNVRARLMTGGDMWWDRGTGTAKYEVPKGSGKSSLFAGSVWVGGHDEQNILKVAGQLFRNKGNDYWPGPTQVDRFGVNSAPDQTICSDWDKFWKVDRSTLIEFRDLQKQHQGETGWTTGLDEKYQSIVQWPATGNSKALGTSGLALPQLTDSNYIAYGRNYAPYVEVNGKPGYQPEEGDYPDILGDQYIWWVFNDMGNVKLQSESVSIGMEVQTSAFAFSSKDFLNDATFVFYKLINRGVLNLNDTYMATWTDADLGYAFDDYIGCDTSRSLGILYNGKSVDGNGAPTDYGSEVPMIGVDFFIGPKRRTYGTVSALQEQFPGHLFHPAPSKGPGQYFNEDTLGMTVFNYFNNGGGPIGDPNNGLEMYRIMTGYSRTGQHLKDDQASCPNSTCYNAGPEINYVWPGNPDRKGDWSECQCGTLPGDRRFVHSSGPFRLEAGGITNDIIIGACWVPNVGGCPNASFSRIRAADDMIQDLFDNHFRTIEGPEAPRLVVREMDRKLVFYLVNDPNSTNFQEQYGYSDSAKYRVSTPRTRRLATNGDSLYKFEGYRVFQLKNSNVSVANIFGDNGEVDPTVAREVFETDIRNGVKGNIVNFVSNPDVKQGNYDAQVKVFAKDSGIQHSFMLNQDAFATGQDKNFVNYRTYYFVAIAYAYNNYKDFSYASADTAQLTPYLESSHAAGGKVIPIVSAMPNPANGNMGTVINSDFGQGVIIKRIEGIGNGGLATAFDTTTENLALNGPDYQAKEPVYRAGEGPISIKVINPDSLKEATWQLFIQGASNIDSTVGIDSGGRWFLIGSLNPTDTIFSERTFVNENEQILEKYGFSVSLRQTARPADVYAQNNGLISSDISFADPNDLWLSGVRDGEGEVVTNWIRSGTLEQPKTATCNYGDVNAPSANPDEQQVYENLIPGSTQNQRTWAPVMLGAVENNGNCGFGVVNPTMQGSLSTLQGVDVVFTSDQSKWTRCVVLEMQDDPNLAEGHARKFFPRSHRSWNLQVDANGNPVYSSDPKDTGFSWFPGYAINQETGERVNIVFGEDSYLKDDNGRDMIWNPTSRVVDVTGGVIFGGKHYIYTLSSRYDQDAEFVGSFDQTKYFVPLYRQFRWMSVPLTVHLLPLSQNLIPTETRVRIRVTKPYGRYIANGSTPGQNNGFPLYTFSTKGMGPTPLADASNPYYNDKQALLDKIAITPNPYYGYTGYENSRLDTRVRIVNLPKTATIRIYATDGTLIRTLTKDNPNQSFIDWDTRNQKNLPIASGMYLIHVQAEGIGETILRWFGAMRPIDLTSF
ncbi:MAG: T9SS type A sorting domain-containing protein [Bacteroidetes bacterium]|nr:T9SS type A sorting domain-containing protein [Bacteroidota bacterium]